MVDVRVALECKAKAVNSALEAAVRPQEPVLIYDAIRYSLFPPSPPAPCATAENEPSQRAHAFLCLSACELFDEGAQEAVAAAMPTACAMEMLHAASLIHDDLPCMDDDDLRYGYPSNHKVFGQDMAILAGDALYALAVQHVAAQTHGVAADRVLRVIAELSRAVGSEGMVAGQFLDLTQVSGRNPNTGPGPNLTQNKVDPEPNPNLSQVQETPGPNSNLDVEGLQAIHLRKMAMLAECSAMCGAVLGGATEEEIENLKQYGRALGLLYHVVDDLMKSRSQFSSSAMDPPTDRATYPGLLGVEKSKELAEELRLKAKQRLQSFDQIKAAPLLCFVDLVADKIQSI